MGKGSLCIHVCVASLSRVIVFHNAFLQEIYELGTSEQGEMHAENGGQGSTAEQSAMETSNGETDNTKVSKI